MEQAHRTAVQAGLVTLYHYEKFNAEFLAITLREQKIHCSNPGNLNDPWDCMPWLDAPALRDPNVFRQAMDSYHELGKGHPLRPDLQEKFESRLQNDPKYLNEFIGGQSKSIQDMVAERRIYCLTPHADSTLMWSHYADNHHGICLEFSVANPLFRNAREVVYRSEYPVWLPHEFHAYPESTLEIVLTKADDWAYEKEFRLVSVRPGTPSAWLAVKGDYFCLPPGALKSVIAGCVADHEAISKVVNEHAPGLATKHARRVANHYRLVIE